MAYRSAIIGCGKRAMVHARAYEQDLDEIRLVALCDLRREALDALGDEFHVDARYEAVEEMLDVEKPDIVHIVTMPDVREQLIDVAADHGVRACIVEKPIALRPTQAAKISATVARTGIKIAVNMQRRYFHTVQALRRVLDEGRIGDIVFVRVVTRGNILSMGPHMVDLLIYLLGDAVAERAWACASGMNGYDYNHPAPANMLVRYVFPNGVTAYLEDADDCVGVPGEDSYWHHAEVDLWAAGGRAWWTQNRDWGYQAEGMDQPVVAESLWDQQDLSGQREFTRAVARWLDGTATHLNSLENSLAGFDMIMAAMHSAFLGTEVPVPSDVSDDIVTQLEERLKP